MDSPDKQWPFNKTSAKTAATAAFDIYAWILSKISTETSVNK